jgi:hypothetical protein
MSAYQVEDVIDELNLKKGMSFPNDNDTADSELHYFDLVGTFLWIAWCTRPDILLAITYILQLSTYATKTRRDAFIRIFRYLETTVEITFVLELTNNTSTDKHNVTTIANSGWIHDIADRKFVPKSSVIANGALVNFATAQQQTTTSTSSTETEFLSTIDACSESSCSRNSLPGLISVIVPIETSLDNIGAGYIVQNYFDNSGTTHFDVKFHMIRDWIATKGFELFHIESSKNSADILVKALAAPAHRGLAHHLPENFLPIKASLGSIGADCIVQNYVSNLKIKHTDAEFHTDRDWIAKEDFKLFHIESNENSVNIFAKALTAPAHHGLAHHLSGGLLLM